MSISKTEAKQLLERLIFEDLPPQQWVEDVWGLTPILGDSAAKLLEVFEALIECCPEDKLDNLLQTYLQAKIEDRN
jgi:uncharacterized protein YecA (UPF0149 family)